MCDIHKRTKSWGIWCRLGTDHCHWIQRRNLIEAWWDPTRNRFPSSNPQELALSTWVGKTFSGNFRKLKGIYARESTRARAREGREEGCLVASQARWLPCPGAEAQRGKRSQVTPWPPVIWSSSGDPIASAGRKAWDRGTLENCNGFSGWFPKVQKKRGNAGFWIFILNLWFSSSKFTLITIANYIFPNPNH